MKTILFGLDGATYTVLDHMVAQGVMPNFKKFREEATSCRLRSTPLPITPQAWTTLATGRSAGNHGMHDFLRYEPTQDGVYFRVNDYRTIAVETIWQYVSDRGKRVTVLNFFGTAPPPKINGHVMPGFVPPKHLRRSSHPSDLFAKLQHVEGFDVNVLGLDTNIEKMGLQKLDPDQWVEWIDLHIRREKAWYGILDHLMRTEPSDLTAIVFDGVDKIQHLAYRYMDPSTIPDKPLDWEKKVIERCKTYFRQVDDFLGAVVKAAGKWARIFIASDHGFTVTTEIVYVNKFLADEGYLTWRGEVAEDAKEAVFVDKLPNLVSAIDLKKTKAFAMTPSCNGIYINRQHLSPEEADKVRDELIEKLYKLKGPDGGLVVSEIKKREDWWPGPFTERAPDLTLTLRDHGLISILNGKSVVVPREEPAGTHHPHGVLLGRGPGIVEGKELEVRDIIEVPQLLLHSLGLEIPGDYEGQFPAAFYEADYLSSDPPRKAQGSAAASAAVPAASPAAPAAEEANLDDDEEAAIMERLRGLGYVE